MSYSCAVAKSERDWAMMDHFRGCFICNTRSRRCSSSALVQALAKAFLDLRLSFLEPLDALDDVCVSRPFGDGCALEM